MTQKIHPFTSKLHTKLSTHQNSKSFFFDFAVLHTKQYVAHDTDYDFSQHNSVICVFQLISACKKNLKIFFLTKILLLVVHVKEMYSVLFAELLIFNL